MARMDVNNIENVEGEFHLMFIEGKNIIESAKSEIRYAWGSLLLFAGLVLISIIISGVNLFYICFMAAFLIVFLAIYIFLKREKRIGVKQCIRAVKNSKSTDIVAKQIDKRKVDKKIVKSVSGAIDKYEAKAKYPNFKQKLKNKRKQRHIAGIINQFNEHNKEK